MNNLPSSIEAGLFDCLDECRNVPHLSERIIVDLVNGLEVSDNHIKFKQSQSRLFRVIGILNGSSQRREILIQEQHQKSLEALVDWVEELTKHGTYTLRIMERVAIHCNQIEIDFARFTGQVTEEFRRQRALLDQLQNALDRLSLEVKEHLERLEGHTRIHEFFAAWKSGRIYNGYPPLVKATFAVDDFSRAEEGSMVFEVPRNRAFFLDCLIDVLNDELGLSKLVWKPLTEWTKRGIPSFAMPRRKVAEYLLVPNMDRNLHTVLGIFALTQRLPDWLEQEQEEGVLQGYYETTGLVEALIEESLSRNNC